MSARTTTTRHSRWADATRRSRERQEKKNSFHATSAGDHDQNSIYTVFRSWSPSRTRGRDAVVSHISLLSWKMCLAVVIAVVHGGASSCDRVAAAGLGFLLFCVASVQVGLWLCCASRRDGCARATLAEPARCVVITGCRGEVSKWSQAARKSRAMSAATSPFQSSPGDPGEEKS